ncbi:hypothetical protein [Proteus mirabilis]|uniref:hypothetical protein n=1 Tax=Proteus mirabilis TaxID=584 RepID=UPI0030C659A5
MGIESKVLQKIDFLLTRYAKGCKHGCSQQHAREPLPGFINCIRNVVSENCHARSLFDQLVTLSLISQAPTH